MTVVAAISNYSGEMVAASVPVPAVLPRRRGPTVPTLLADEDPSSLDPRDARSWIAVYEQLLAVKGRQLERLRGGDGRIPGAVDVALLDDQLAGYRQQLTFWYDRYLELVRLGLDDESRVLMRDGMSAQLTRREHQLLQAFVKHPDQYLRPRQLVTLAWQDAHLSDEEVRIYIGSLRQKLRSLGAGAIVNRRGRGYMLVLAEGDAPSAALQLLPAAPPA
ncbi:MAG: winged helix-turn-helix domain-containing protein [Candidatus Dormibacteria bacterium]